MAAKIILVVDDEKDVVDWREKKISSKAYVILKALTAKEALAKSKRHKPDLVLMDIVLPDMEGSEAVRMLADDPQTTHIPVIFMSGIVSREDENTQMELNVGGRLYRAVSKPFKFEELLKEIQETLL